MNDQIRTVGLMADPGMPSRIAAAIADDLSDDLTRELGGRWRVESGQETLPLGPDGEVRLAEHAPRLLREHGWEFVLYVTDLPSRHNGAPLLYDVSGSSAAALVSLPAFGAVRVRSKVRTLALKLVCSGVYQDGLGAPGTDGLPSAECTGLFAEPRVLAGMVFNNRPHRLVTALTGVVAAAAATGAFGVFYGSIASLAAALHPLRLLLISVLSILTLVGWLIMRNGLWNSSHNKRTPGKRGLDNVATLLTVGIGVGLMFLGLLVAMFLVALVVMESGYLGGKLGRPAEIFDYVHLAWLSTCLGTFAGALGSNFDDEDTVREATYSLRWHERRKMFGNYEGDDDDRREQQERQRIEREHDSDSDRDSNGDGDSDRDGDRDGTEQQRGG